MPQMSPMNWSLIMMITSCLIIVTKLMNYSVLTYQNTKKYNIKTPKSSWKW